MAWALNNIRIILVFGSALGLVGLVGWLLGSIGGLMLSLGGALTCGTIGWFGIDRIAIFALRGREAHPQQSPELVAMVRRSSEKVGIPTPRIYICPQRFVSAFATGRDPRHASIAVTQGALGTFDQETLQQLVEDAVLRIRLRSTLPSTISATLMGFSHRLSPMNLAGIERRRRA